MGVLPARFRAMFNQITPEVWRILVHSMLFGLAISIAELLLNFYLASMGYGTDVAGYLTTIYRIAGVVCGLPMGLLIDRWGPRRAILTGAIAYAGAWVIQLLVRDFWALALAQFMIGTSFTMIVTSVTPLLASVTSSEQRPAVLGFNAASTLVVGVMGNIFGGALPGLAASIVGSDPQGQLAYRLALGSVVILGLLAAIPIWMLRSIKANPDRVITPEKVDQQPNLPWTRLFRFALPYLFMGAAGGAIIPFQNLFLRQVFDLGDASVGLVLGWNSLVMGIGALLGAPLSKRFGAKRLSIWARFAAAPAMLLMFLPWVWPAAIGICLRGLFISLSYPISDALTMQYTPTRQRGFAMSLVNALWSLGWATAAAVSGWAQITWGFVPLLWASIVLYGFSGYFLHYALADQN